MKTIADFLSTDAAHALGWTLLHSLWQSIVIWFLVAAILRLIPPALSRVRYASAVGGLFFLSAAAIVTFLYLAGGRNMAPAPDHTVVVQVGSIGHASTDRLTAENALSLFRSFVDARMPLILMLWMAGFFFFVLRFISSLYATFHLHASALPLENRWSDYIRRVSSDLGISRVVTLAECASLATPIVIGYFKPAILIPVGMLSGLTTEQIETILVHELAHIRRHDYLINFLQSVIETVFFFNPFAWILSDFIRREREYCCDDVVIAQHGDAKAYAYALAQLAEARLPGRAFALPVAPGNNQLLNRIKRIMERSVRNYSGTGRMVVPVVLLMAGLFCVSWLGIPAANSYQADPAQLTQDTIKKKNGKSARYSRKTIITTDENGQPHEQVVEEFEGDDALRQLMPVPPIPDISVVPPVPDVPVRPLLPHIDLKVIPDTIPPPSFPFYNREEWQQYSRAFRKDFRKSFEELLQFRHGDVKDMMQELERFRSKAWADPLFRDSAAFKDLERQLETLRDFQIPDLERQLQRLQDIEMENLERQLDLLQDLDLEHIRDQAINGPARIFGSGFMPSLQKKLIEDGYLREDETISTMEWEDDVLKVNEKTIRPEDEKKYRKLHEEYFDRRFHPGKLE